MRADRNKWMTGTEPLCRLQLAIRGAVQGVGFRPHVHRLAHDLGLCGWVRNTPAGVLVELEGPRRLLDSFRLRLNSGMPPLASIQGVEPRWLDPIGLAPFEISTSLQQGPATAVVLPDAATCPACVAEIFDVSQRRYRYPFTNCTHCGPRYTIIDALPYDRCRTSMATFAMCAGCRSDYENPADRRFHAQPIACPDCGPQLSLWSPDKRILATGDDALRAVVSTLRGGGLVAAKGLGGFHLLADAANGDAVQRLRRAKARTEKPFAVMYPDLASIRHDCCVSDLEAHPLTSPQAPIVLLHRRTRVNDDIAPGLPWIGAMLPYTPLHHLLLGDMGRPLVATSGNLADEPICIDNDDAWQQLGHLIDALLVHDRPIRHHADDSVVRVVGGRELVLRRARGFAPWPLPLPASEAMIGDAIAVGGQMKNAVAVAAHGRAVLGPHVGDLEHPETSAVRDADITALVALHDVVDPLWVCDLHPDYESTRRAMQAAAVTGRTPRAVQHHYAHVRACMLENDLPAPTLGVAWDGSGYGTDGTIWGGEFLLALPEGGFRRVAHLRPFRLPGGDAAAHEPRRSALGVLHELLGADLWRTAGLAPLAAISDVERRVFARMLDGAVHAPLTSSAGRLFDAVAALLGLRQINAYEGQAAMLLEAAAERGSSLTDVVTPACLLLGDGPIVVDWGPLLLHLLTGLQAGASADALAFAFHQALSGAIVDVAVHLGVERVALTGGCLQNALLTELCITGLGAAGLRPYWHQGIPPNDGGLALGQLAAACDGSTGG